MGELNQSIWELLDELNDKPFKKLEGSRSIAFEKLEKPAMWPLPRVRYELAERRQARLNLDYHIELDRRYYSAPYPLESIRSGFRSHSIGIPLIRSAFRSFDQPFGAFDQPFRAFDQSRPSG